MHKSIFLSLSVVCIFAYAQLAECQQTPATKEKVAVEVFFNPLCSASMFFFESGLAPLKSLLQDPRVVFTVSPVRLDKEGSDMSALSEMMCLIDRNGSFDGLEQVVREVQRGTEKNIELSKIFSNKKLSSGGCPDRGPYFKEVVNLTVAGFRAWTPRFAPRLFIQGVESGAETSDEVRSEILWALGDP